MGLAYLACAAKLRLTRNHMVVCRASRNKTRASCMPRLPVNLFVDVTLSVLFI